MSSWKFYPIAFTNYENCQFHSRTKYHHIYLSLTHACFTFPLVLRSLAFIVSTSFSLSLSYTHTNFLSLTHTHTHPLSRTHTHSLPYFLSFLPYIDIYRWRSVKTNGSWRTNSSQRNWNKH